MWFKNRTKLIAYIIMLTFLMVISLQVVIAQTNLLTCVYIEPKIEGDGGKYSIEFRNTDVVGLILPADAEVIIYGNIEMGSYKFRTEAETGSYKVTEELDTYTARALDASNNNIPSECPNVDPATTLATRPFDVLPSDLVIITQTGRGNYDLNTLLGVASFHFAPPLPGFQIVQLKGQFIEFSLPYLSEPITDFTAIANKTGVNLVSLRTIQTPDSPVEVIRYIEPAYDYRTFINTLAAPQDAIELLKRINAQIYPVSGRVSQYHQGDFIRLDMGNANPPDPRGLGQGTIVRSIPGAEASLYLASNPDGGVIDTLTCNSANQCQTVKITKIENGLLYVDDQIIKESWFVEPVPPQQ